MCRRKQPRTAGFSLLELTIAVTVFVIVLGVVAQGLVSYYVVMDAQHQRATAAEVLRGALAQIRATRDANPNAFPSAITQAFPDGAAVPGPGLLPNEAIAVVYADDTANPLEVSVTVTWTDLHGRPLQETMSTLLTDR